MNNDGDLNLECVPITAVSMGDVQMTSVVEPMTSNSNTHTLEPKTSDIQTLEPITTLNLIASNLGSQTMEPMTSDAHTLEPTTVVQALYMMPINLGTHTLEPIRNNPMITLLKKLKRLRVGQCGTKEYRQMTLISFLKLPFFQIMQKYNTTLVYQVTE